MRVAMTLGDYIACLKSLRVAVADLRARMFTEGVEGAPVNLQSYGGDLIGVYATLTEMMKDVGGFEGKPLADALQGLEDSEEKDDYL